MRDSTATPLPAGRTADEHAQLGRELVKLYAPFGAWRQFYAWFRVALSRFDQVESFLPRSGRVLDLGCGYGVLSNYLALAAPGRSVTGIDLNERRIAVARQTIGARSNIAFMAANVMTADLPSCDAVIMSDFLHHLSLEQQERLLRRLEAALAPAGRLLIQEVNTVPRLKYACSHLADLVLYPFEARPRFRSSEDWVRVLRASGFPSAQVIRGDIGTVFARVSYLVSKQAETIIPSVDESIA